MAIPFAGLFKKAKERLSAATNARAAAAAAVPVPEPYDKPSSDRMSKTVMPNATRTLAPSDPFEIAMHATGNGVTIAAPSASRMVAVGRTQPSNTARDLPPAVAFALAPKIERTISLALVDIVPHMPKELVKPSAGFDTEKRILLKAADVEKGMAKGAPKVSLSFIYQQVPDIFMRKIELSDPTQVALPIDKVLEQFSHARLRRDQIAEVAVPQVDTPFLQVTIEDTKKFGGTMEPITTFAAPSLPTHGEPATAKSISDAEPEAAPIEKFAPPPPEAPAETAIKPALKARRSAPYVDALPPRQPVKLDVPGAATTPPAPTTNGATPATAKKADAPAPHRIPIKFPPNGTGELASTRVPASGGPPVPTSEPAATPTRIPFKFAAPAAVSAPEVAAVPIASNGERQVTLALRPIMETIPPMQLNGDPAAVGDATISFACSVVQPQLASGRIGIPPKDFLAAMPQEHRALFNADALDVPISLSLADVLKNMPASSLQLRDDQEEVITAEEFATPFALKAKEDAERLGTAKPAVAALAPAVEKKSAAPAAAPKLDAKTLVARASELPGVASCSVTFTDGLSLAGNIPDDIGIEGISAMAPAMLQRMEKHMPNTKLGQLSAMTLHCTESPVTFVMCGNICLTAVHNGKELTAATREQLATMTREISQTYSQPETTHVDH